MVRKVDKHQKSKQTGPDLCCKSTRNNLLYFARFCAGSTPKIANKNVKQRTLPSFQTISLNSLWFDYLQICVRFLQEIASADSFNCGPFQTLVSVSMYFQWNAEYFKKAFKIVYSLV